VDKAKYELRSPPEPNANVVMNVLIVWITQSTAIEELSGKKAFVFTGTWERHRVTEGKE